MRHSETNSGARTSAAALTSSLERRSGAWRRRRTARTPPRRLQRAAPANPRGAPGGGEAPSRPRARVARVRRIARGASWLRGKPPGAWRRACPATRPPRRTPPRRARGAALSPPRKPRRRRRASASARGRTERTRRRSAYESRAVAASSRLSPRVARGVRFWNLPAARRRRGGGLGAAPPARPLGRPLLGRLLGRGASFARNVRASGVRFPRRLFLSGPGRTPPVAAAPRPAVAPARLLGVSVRAGRGDGERHGVAGRAARGSRGGESGRERRLPVGVAIAIGVARRDSARPPRLAVAVHLGGRGIVQVVPVPVRVGRGTETRGFFKTHVSRRVTGSTSIASRSSESRFRSRSAFLRNVRRRARSRNR